ncbi:MAG: sugar phosphate isomerase/epimerase family protein [Opitutaceae bacterium]|nr:sugar phosphate isomerase/epimerase family protein [Opitutaceae bacterium]
MSRHTPLLPWSRRNFIKLSALAAGTLAFGQRRGAASTTGNPPLFTAMGIAAPLASAAELKEAGAQFLTEGVGSFLVPDKGEAEFALNLERLAASPLPVLACNGFIRPAHLRCVGAEANHDQVLDWADICFKRLHRAGGSLIVFGSGGSRELRDGWPKDKADEQFVALLKRMGPLAEAQGIVVVVEQLQARECNYINHLSEAAAVIRATGHPNVRLLADFYHMACMGDTPSDLAGAMDVVAHVEIAEKEGRTVPGVQGEDFRPFLRVLREHRYKGAISIEGKFEPSQVSGAFKEIRRQALEV